MAIIEAKILDRKFTRLIWKSLKTGHLELYHNNIIRTGSIISPLLANIFMNQLDVFIDQVKNNFDLGKESRESKESNIYHYLMTKAKKDGDMILLKKLAKEKLQIPWAADPRYKKLAYVRYADNWLVGIKGSLEDTKLIYGKIEKFLTSIGLNQSKTKITNISRSKVSFLGTRIYRAKDTKFVRIVGKSSIKSKRKPRKLRIEAPIDKIIKKLYDAGFMSKGKSHPKFV